MSSAEDIMYKAHNEGIRAEVFIESQKLREENPMKYKYKENVDILEEAYKIVLERKNKKNENI
jgi:hypothetical protein|tara:strand:+ start:560 stop:748 length:189 start_codon:yes stop_codon:yes gene_type:complete